MTSPIPGTPKIRTTPAEGSDVSLYERLREDIVSAMRAKDELTRDTLRMVVASIKRKEIDDNRPLTEEEVLAVVRSAVKTRKDSLGQFTKAGRTDLAEKEESEINVLAGYLPKQLDEAETRALIARLVEETGAASAADPGRVMKALMAGHKGLVDGKLAQIVLGELLS